MSAARRLYAFHCGGATIDMARYDPFSERVGTPVYAPYFLYLVEHPDGHVLFDTGPRLGSDDTVGPDDVVEGKLGSLGLKPGDVDHVVVSHLHGDHAGGLSLFEHATIYVQRSELQFASSPPPYCQVYDRADFDPPLRWEQLADDHDMFGDGQVVIFPTPGHTPGHQSLMVKLESQTVLVLGDVTYTIAMMRERRLPALLWSADDTMRSWERIERLEDEHDATLLCSHELDFEALVRQGPDEWYE